MFRNESGEISDLCSPKIYRNFALQNKNAPDYETRLSLFR